MQKKRKRIYIFGIPLKAEPGDPVGAPEWYHKLINALLDVGMAFFLVDLYLFFDLVSQLTSASALALPWLP